MAIMAGLQSSDRSSILLSSTILFFDVMVKFGGLVQSARTLHLQCRGHGFESHTLHKNVEKMRLFIDYRQHKISFMLCVIW